MQTSLLAADSWALLAACHDYELDAQRAQDEFEIERARLEKEVRSRLSNDILAPT